jgi:hypothetical protein
MGKGRMETFSDGVVAERWFIPDRRIEKTVAK